LRHFSSEEDVKTTVSEWLQSQPQDFYISGIKVLMQHWSKCFERTWDYIKG
jgi:hypothetical protein